jgi:multidrug efflux pump subunit AcrB
VQGVAEVASIGGFVKQYQIELSSKMRAANVTLMEVINAVQNANLNVGGKTIEENGAEFVLRGIGLVTSPEDLELVTVKASMARRSISRTSPPSDRRRFPPRHARHRRPKRSAAPWSCAPARMPRR